MRFPRRHTRDEPITKLSLFPFALSLSKGRSFLLPWPKKDSPSTGSGQAAIGNHRWVTLIAFALLAACGNKGDLERLASAAPPVIPAGSDQPESPDEQTTLTAEARPARSDELLRRSEERPTDEFDLPPQ